METQRETGIHIDLLGQLRVSVDGEELAEIAWPGRRSAELFHLLALADHHRMLRDRTIDALWPHLDAEAGAANLRKAAHQVRQALGHQDAVVLAQGQVALFPSRRIETDVERFEQLARNALRGQEPAACAEVAAAYPGDLLPESLYEEWTQVRREELRAQRVRLLQGSRQWELVVELDPTNEQPYQELMRAALAAGDRHTAIRWYGRLRTALEQELRLRPSDATEAIYAECIAGFELSEPTFVGRQSELAVAAEAIADSSRLRALIIRGEAGIGKSSLCRKTGSSAIGAGWRVLSVTAAREDRPYAPVTRAAEQLIDSDRALLDRLPEQSRAVLGRLTEFANPATPLHGRLTRHRVIGAMHNLLAAHDGPIMLIVDDAHLADEASIDALVHLILGDAAVPVLIVLAYRPEPIRQSLARGVALIERAQRAAVIDVSPLDADEVQTLVGSHVCVGPDEADRIVDLAHGNPFLALELARNAASSRSSPAGPRVGDAVTSRFLDLDEDSLGMLQRLAVAGEVIDTGDVLALTGMSEPEAYALLDAALESGGMVVDGDSYRFRHDLVRQALIEQVPPHRRMLIHRDAASRFEAAGAAPATIARHWLAGGHPEPAQIWLMAAALQAFEFGAFADALRQLDLLLSHDPTHAEALRLRAEALDVRGDSAAPAAYAAAAAVVAGGAADDLRAKQALAQIKLGDPPGALETLAGLEPVSVEGRLAQALTLSGAAALGFIDPALGTAKAAECRRLALQSGDTGALVIASWANAAAAHARGDLRVSVQTDLRETQSLRALATSVFDGQLCISQRLLYGARPYADVIAFADALEVEADQLGATRGQAFAVTLRGEAMFLAGRLDEAEHELREAARLNRTIGASVGEALAIQRLADVAHHRGDTAACATLLDEALSVARESDVGFHLFDRIYGSKIAAAQDPAAALIVLEEAEAAVRGPDETCPGCRITLAVPAAIAAARAGDLERAGEYAQASEFLAGVVMRLPAWDAAYEEVQGHCALAAGDDIHAEQHFAAASKGFAACGQPIDADRCAALAARNVSGTAG